MQTAVCLQYSTPASNSSSFHYLLTKPRIVPLAILCNALHGGVKNQSGQHQQNFSISTLGVLYKLKGAFLYSKLQLLQTAGHRRFQLKNTLSLF